MIYIDNDPIKPVLYVGVVFYKYENGKINLLFIENENLKIDIIKDKIDLDMNTSIQKLLQYHTNFLIDLSHNEIDNLLKTNTTYSTYISSELTVIYFMQALPEICILTHEDFGTYTIVSNDKKYRRSIKWIDDQLLFKFIYRYKKASKTLNYVQVKNEINCLIKKYKLNEKIMIIHKQIKMMI